MHSAAPAQAVFASDITDEALANDLPGFTNAFATVNGVRIHYVKGGTGPLILLLPGWPETWWEFHKIMPALSATNTVVAVDLRGMGSSGKPDGGYDKKTMASDIVELGNQLGFDKFDVLGHDIGSMVAFSLAANHPDHLNKAVLIEGAHPTPAFRELRLLPQPGTFGEKIDEAHPYLWWFAFHQVKGMTEELLEGRAHVEQHWFFRYMSLDESAIDSRDRAVYAAAYNTREATRAADGWYQAFAQDINDFETYATLTVPVLGLGGVSYNRLKSFLDESAPGSRCLRVEGSGHFIAEEKPAELLGFLREFLSAPK